MDNDIDSKINHEILAIFVKGYSKHFLKKKFYTKATLSNKKGLRL